MFALPDRSSTFSSRAARRAFLCALVLLGLRSSLHAQENYFVTYRHEMEEPGNLEIAAKSVTGVPTGGDAFVATALEFGYKTCWLTGVYLDRQPTTGQSTLFTGFRWEHRVRPLLREGWINPVLYFEFEDINGADKALLEVVGHDGRIDFLARNNRSEKKREVELKLTLASNSKG